MSGLKYRFRESLTKIDLVGFVPVVGNNDNTIQTNRILFKPIFRAQEISKQIFPLKTQNPPFIRPLHILLHLDIPIPTINVKKLHKTSWGYRVDSNYSWKAHINQLCKNYPQVFT